MNKPHAYPSISDNTKSSIIYSVFDQVFVFGHVFGVRLLFVVGVRWLVFEISEKSFGFVSKVIYFVNFTFILRGLRRK